MNEKEIFTEDFWKGEERKFEEFVNAYKEKVFRICYSILQNRQDAEDATQEAFVRIYQNLKKFKGESAPFTWIYKIAKNCAINFMKKRNKMIFFESDIKDEERQDLLDRMKDERSEIDININNEKNEKNKIIIKMINELPKKYKEVIELKYYGEFEVKEIAEILGCPVNTVKIRLFRAYKILRKKLKGGQWE